MTDKIQETNEETNQEKSKETNEETNNKKDFSVIKKQLKKLPAHSTIDKNIFNEYVNKRITLRQCKKEFMENNRMSIDFPDDLFKDWLSSIGWRRNNG